MATRYLTQICACAIVIATSASAAPLLPPAEYDHEFEGRIELVQVHPREVYRHCREHYYAPRGVKGCSITIEPDHCLIIMVDRPVHKVADLTHLYRHERAHCNGWRH